MRGWRYEWVQALPFEVYEVLLDMIEEAQTQQAQPGLPTDDEGFG